MKDVSWNLLHTILSDFYMDLNYTNVVFIYSLFANNNRDSRAYKNCCPWALDWRSKGSWVDLGFRQLNHFQGLNSHLL